MIRNALALLLMAAWPARAAAQFVNVTVESGLEAIRASKAAGYWMSGLLFLDLDGDGDLDFFFGAHHGEGGIASLNDGRGHFTAVTSWSPSEIHVPYDLDEDGRLDVVLTENDGGGRWWLGKGSPGAPAFARSTLADPQARLQVLLDINRDGKADWIAVGSGSGSAVKENVRVYLGDGKGGFGPPGALPGVFNLTDLVDLDGDGDKDAVWALGNYPNSPPEPVETHILRNDGMTFTDVTAQAGMAVPGLHIQGWGDVDQDGDVDLIGLENNGRFPVVVYLNDGKGLFGKLPDAIDGPTGRAVAANPGQATTADVDNDGIVDILIGGVSFFQVLRGTGGAHFSHMNARWGGITSAGELPDASFAFGDLDGDGDLDLACYRTTQPQQLNVYRNDLPAKNWLNVRAVGLPGNKGAMGSAIRVYEAGGEKLLWFEELSTTAKQVQLNAYFFVETERHFGLGDRTVVDVAVQFYPSNKVVKKTGVRANTTVRIGEDGEGTVVPPPAPPDPPATPVKDAGPPERSVAADAAPGLAADTSVDKPPLAGGCSCRLGEERGRAPWASVCLVIALMALSTRRGQRGKGTPPPLLLSLPVVAKAEAAVVAGAVGQRTLLESVYREHAAIVKRWALRLGGPGIDIEDAVHEVFLVVQRRLPEFRGDAQITTWLYRITSNVVHKQVRKQRTRRWLSGLGAFADDVKSDLTGPYETVERQHAARTVYRALEGLKENHRSVVILYELEGMSGEEIAALLQTKLATVWVWLHRGRAKFLERLKALGEEGGSR
jgi:RNA polymerase sigma-70 factor (ECF subfamily)